MINTVLTVQFKFALQQRVQVVAIKTEGVVCARCEDINGQQYRVIYWNDGTRKSIWMYDYELEAKDEG